MPQLPTHHTVRLPGAMLAPIRLALLTALRWQHCRRGPDDTITDGYGQPYLLRWYVTPKSKDGTLADSGGWYLHNMLRPDAVKDCHDHPWSFQTWVLSGAYLESIQFLPPGRLGVSHRDRMLQAGDTATVNSRHRHRVVAVAANTWTLVRYGPRQQTWGFYNEGGVFTDWKTYMASHNGRSAL